ncbi:MAG: helix-turn-helix domain-containing protein [Terriglobales bacterium]
MLRPTEKSKTKPFEPYPFIARVDAAKFLVVSVQQIDKYILAGVLHPLKVGRKVIFRRDELLRLVETGGFPVLPRPLKAVKK